MDGLFDGEFVFPAFSVVESPLVPPGEAILDRGARVAYVAKYDRYGYRVALGGLGRSPLYTRCSIGMREAARDKRRAWRKGTLRR